MIFSFLILFLFAVAIPLWMVRQWSLSSLAPRARKSFKRLLQHKETALQFGMQMLAALLAFSGMITVFLYTMSYFKTGRLSETTSYDDLIRNRLYSGVEQIDPALNAVYGLPFPLVAALKCLLITISFTLVIKALSDLQLISRLKKRLEQQKAPA